jgi:hypothetical protein
MSTQYGDYKHSEQARPPATHNRAEGRARCGAPSFLRKPLHYKAGGVERKWFSTLLNWGSLRRLPPIRIGIERGRQVTASPVMTKSWGPSWGKQLPGKRPHETAENVTYGPSAQPVCPRERRHTA